MARAAIMMRRARGTLVPADAWAAEQLEALPDNKELSVRVSVMSSTGKTEREGARGLWWGGLDVLSQNTDNPLYQSKRLAHDNILTALGYVRPRFRIDNTVEYIPVSTSEDNLDDEEFLLLFEKARAHIVNKVGFDPWEMWKSEHDAAAANRRYR